MQNFLKKCGEPKNISYIYTVNDGMVPEIH